MINIRNAKKYCCEDLSLIENYELAVSDTNEMWAIHHRDEDKEMITLLFIVMVLTLGAWFFDPKDWNGK